MGIGTPFSAIGELRNGMQASAADRYRAAVAQNNAIVAEQNAQYAEQKGNAKEGVVREQTAQTIGEQRAAMAGNNVEAGSGSALRLQTDAAAIGETEAQTVRNDAAREAYAWRMRRQGFNNDAQIAQWRVGQDKQAGYIGYWSAGLGGASGVAARAGGSSFNDTAGSTSAGSTSGSTVGSGSGYSSKWDGWSSGSGSFGDAGGGSFAADDLLV